MHGDSAGESVQAKGQRWCSRTRQEVCKRQAATRTETPCEPSQQIRRSRWLQRRSFGRETALLCPQRAAAAASAPALLLRQDSRKRDARPGLAGICRCTAVLRAARQLVALCKLTTHHTRVLTRVVPEAPLCPKRPRHLSAASCGLQAPLAARVLLAYRLAATRRRRSNAAAAAAAAGAEARRESRKGQQGSFTAQAARKPALG